MKKYYIIIFLVLIFGRAMSQEVEWSAKAGMNVTNLGKSGYLDRIGYHFGSAAEFITTPFFSVQTELLYSLQGAAIDYSQGVFLNYHYLNLPLFAKAYFTEDASFEFGVQYGFLLNAIDRDVFGKENITDDVNRHDFAMVLGFNYNINDKYNLGLRYNIGVTNTQKLDIVYEERITNRVLMISGAIIF